MATHGRPAGGAGRSPRRARTTTPPRRRTRAALPSRAPTPATVARAKRATLTARAAILAVALASVALAIALPFKIWVGQRGQISALESQTRAQEHQVAQLRAERARWQDPAYVRQQARVRLHFAMPGEKTYVVLSKPRHKPSAGPATTPSSDLSGPWYSRLWQSVEAAGRSPAGRS